MRLLWEEDVLGVVGAFCVAAAALALAWTALEAVIGFGPVVSGMLAFGAAACAIEGLSRHRYGPGRLAVPGGDATQPTASQPIGASQPTGAAQTTGTAQLAGAGQSTGATAEAAEELTAPRERRAA